MPFTLFFYKKMTWIFKPFLNYLGNFEQIISSILDGKLSISSLVNDISDIIFLFYNKYLMHKLRFYYILSKVDKK